MVVGCEGGGTVVGGFDGFGGSKRLVEVGDGLVCEWSGEVEGWIRN